MTGRTILALFSMLLAGAAPLAAQDGRNGIAFVQAVEQGSGVCTGATPEKAFACAQKKCVESGAARQDCMQQAWCNPAFWSVDVFLQSEEGPHWHEYYCGWNSKDLALAAVKTVCDKALRPGLMECSAVMVYDEDGKEYPVE